MPVDVQIKTTRTYRRTTAEGVPANRQREQESKRVRGEIACAECRRLKLRCDRKTPCTTCIRRGCVSICPNGVLSSGQGTRFDLADTEKLYRKLTQMSERIKQLEESLEMLQRVCSNTRHPLLSEELLQIKFGVDGTNLTSPEYEEEESELLDVFGTLTISEGGASRFLGRTGGPESLLMTEEDEEVNDKQPAFGLPSIISHISETWPFTTSIVPKTDLISMIESQLPSWERAWALCEAYTGNLSWYIRTVQRAQIVEELFPAMYKRNISESTVTNISDIEPTKTRYVANAHELAVLFMVFALGAVCDMTLPPNNDEAELYHQLARAALGLQDVLDSPSLAAVQALSLMGVYCLFSGRKRTMETGWLTTNFAINLAVGIGLDHDPSCWNVAATMAERRRTVFWELFVLDNWQSLANGRPATFALQSVDCKYPKFTQELDARDSILPGFWDWKYPFARNITSQVAYRLSSTEPLKYSEVLELDRKVRGFTHRPVRPSSGANNLGNSGPMLDMQFFAVSVYHDILSLHIHRIFFVKALIDHPADPLQSPYAPSFLSSYRSATSVLKTMRAAFDWFPSFISRFWPFWVHTVSATVMIGSIVTRGPNCSTAPAAFIELNLAVNLFEKANSYVPMIAHALPILVRLREKAHDAYTKYQNGYTTPLSDGGQRSEMLGTEGQDELSILGGQTRLLSTKNPANMTPLRSPSPYVACTGPSTVNTKVTDIPTPTVSTVESEKTAVEQYIESMQPHQISKASSTENYPRERPGVVSWMDESPSPSSAPPHRVGEVHQGGSASQAAPQAPTWPSSTSATTDDPELSAILASLPYSYSVATKRSQDSDVSVEDVGMDNAWISFMQDSGLLGSGILENLA